MVRDSRLVTIFLQRAEVPSHLIQQTHVLRPIVLVVYPADGSRYALEDVLLTIREREDILSGDHRFANSTEGSFLGTSTYSGGNLNHKCRGARPTKIRRSAMAEKDELRKTLDSLSSAGLVICGRLFKADPEAVTVNADGAHYEVPIEYITNRE